jgi:hypothetical protein
VPQLCLPVGAARHRPSLLLLPELRRLWSRLVAGRAPTDVRPTTRSSHTAVLMGRIGDERDGRRVACADSGRLPVLAATPTCGRRRADPYTVAMKRGMHPCPRSVFSWPLGAHGCDVGLAGRNMANSLPGLSPPAACDGSHRYPLETGGSTLSPPNPTVVAAHAGTWSTIRAARVSQSRLRQSRVARGATNAAALRIKAGEPHFSHSMAPSRRSRS